ncbi:glycoside hydrolase family 43 protein [Paenibacillus camelliae]|uniref:glycoside hydrolase family 43 protein n=1 Tax=Paenibacillus camelliae TaxID=512410 RepID=UPI002559C142|nr:glycoside hydrolase family 43 protein [Paenibacillus camelliae]
MNKKWMIAMSCAAALLLVSACSKEQPAPSATPEQTVNQEDGDEQQSNEQVKEQEETPAATEQMTIEEGTPVFTNASVHDPSVIYADGMFYVYGSHLAAAKSPDLMNWTLIGTGVVDGNPLIPNVKEEMAEALEWGQTETFWAGDVIQLADGKYYFYYSVCKGDSPRAAIGLAVSDSPEGPFEDLGMFLKSGMWGQPSEDGTIYDATVHPNAIDPHVFFDKEGLLWMVYGSYSGGIFIMELDPSTGLPLPDQGYGKKLLGKNHVRIEGPYIQYSPETDYYYLFLSYGGLDANGGYNMRIARSKQPDGPYLDSMGNDLIDAQGPPGSFFDDRAIEPYGVKLVGNFMFRRQPGESGGGVGAGYVSPGHNSTFHDEESGKYFNIFHTRFPFRGEGHEIRVHQMFLNEDDWFVMAPHRYAGETIGTYTKEEAAGAYKLVNHGRDISAEVKNSIVVELQADGKITGELSGSWELSGEHNATLKIDDVIYRGVFLRQYDELTTQEVMTFSVLSEEGISLWGSAVALKE